jgi:hypothetical protein
MVCCYALDLKQYKFVAEHVFGPVASKSPSSAWDTGRRRSSRNAKSARVSTNTEHFCALHLGF